MLSSHPPKETSATPECRGSARPLTEGGETRFPDESRSWDLLMQVKREVCVCVPGMGSDWISVLTYKTTLTHVQTVIMLAQ